MWHSITAGRCAFKILIGTPLDHHGRRLLQVANGAGYEGEYLNGGPSSHDEAAERLFHSDYELTTNWVDFCNAVRSLQELVASGGLAKRAWRACTANNRRGALGHQNLADWPSWFREVDRNECGAIFVDLAEHGRKLIDLLPAGLRALRGEIGGVDEADTWRAAIRLNVAFGRVSLVAAMGTVSVVRPTC